MAELTINNINNFLTTTGDFSPLIASDITLLNNIVINYINLYEQSINEQDINEQDTNEQDIKDYDENDHCYRIKSSLNLMDPYLTSGRDIVITKDMKLKFTDTLKQKTESEQLSKKNGFCFATTNITTNTKDECISSDGVWDTIPNSSDECPYYNSNQNYPNDFGKLSGEQCQLPINMKIIGYRNYSNENLIDNFHVHCLYIKRLHFFGLIS